MRRISPVDATFVVRVSLDRRGRLTGTVERVKTGEKHRFDRPEGLGGIISRMVARRADEAAEASSKRVSLRRVMNLKPVAKRRADHSDPGVPGSRESDAGLMMP